MAEDVKKKALFVCLGNSCRSPISEGVFIHTVNKMGKGHEWEVDSAAIADWNVGYPPSQRAIDTMKKYGIRYHGIGRQITTEDFNHYDYIFGMDGNNIMNLNSLAPVGHKAKILLLGDFDPEGDRIIRDPYFDRDAKGFDKCYHQAARSIKGFLEQLENGNIQ